MTATYTNELTAKQIKALEALDYTVPPACQGQICIYGYASVDDGVGGAWIVERWHDQSDGETTFSVRSAEGDEQFEPWNCAPGGEFLPVEAGDKVLAHV